MEEPEVSQADLDAFFAAQEARTSKNGNHPHGALTDLKNAERLIADHGQQLRYVHPWNRWLLYADGRWQDDNQGHAEHLAKQTIRQLLNDAADILDDKIRGRAIKDIIAAERAGRIRGMLDLARSEPGIPAQPTELDQDPWLFNVRNGTVDLTTGELQPHDRSQLITKQAPVEYDPEAKCPQWHQFLERVVPDPELRAFLPRIVGYSMTGLTTEQILIILYGSGANGKTTFIELIRHMFGDYGQQSPPETFLEHRDSIPNDVARLRGARFVAASEITEGRRLNESLVKRMTGGDTMTARFMRSEYFEFRPQFTPWLATNHRPEIRGTDEAIWRRVKLIPFTETIPPAERNHKLPTRLQQELPGILNWAIDGCIDWQLNSLGEPDSVKAATAEYRTDMDSLGRFIDDTCVLETDQTARSADVYNAYREWSKTNGIDPISAQALGRRLAERGLEQSRTESARWWKGIGLRTEQEKLL